MRTLLYTINKIAYLSSLLLCFCLFTYLFYQMAILNIDTSAPEFWTKPYYSDLPFHIETAPISYSLMGLFMRITYTFFSFNIASVLLATLLALMELLTVYAVYLLLLELDKIAGRETNAMSRAIYLWLSLASIFIVSYYLPPVLPSFYYYAINMTCWQNDTYIAMRPFSILALLFFIRIYTKIRENYQLKELIIFSVCLLLSTWNKPNFFLGFAFLLLIIAAFCLIRETNKVLIFKRWFILALCTIPAVVCILLQNALVYGGDSGDSIIFAPFLLVNYHVTNWYLAILVVLLFPVCVAIFENKKSANMNPIFCILFLFLVIQYSFGLFLAESGPRMYDFNFMWGMTLSTSLLCIWSFHTWYNQILCQYSDKKFVTIFSNENLFGTYFVFGLVVLAHLLITGLVFFTLLITGNVSFVS